MNPLTTTLTAAAIAMSIMHGMLVKTCADVKPACAKLDVVKTKEKK